MTKETINAKIAEHEARLGILTQTLQSLATQQQAAQIELHERRGAIAGLQEILALEPAPEAPKVE